MKIYIPVVFILFAICLNKTAYAQNSPWTLHVIDSSLSGADGVRLADVNKDGFLDIATGWEEAGYTKVYLHPGYSKVKQNWPSVIVGNTPSVEDAVFADLNNNGAYDVVSSTEGKTRKIFVNWAPENRKDYLDSSKWMSEVLPASDGLMKWMFAIPAQLDEKNGLDIIAGSKGSNAKIGWFQGPKNPRDPSSWKWYAISSVTWTMSILLRDIDHDGDLDIVSSDRKPGLTNGIRWLENPGDIKKQKQEWDNHFIGAKGLEVMFMDMGDLDGDGLEDAVVPEYTNQKIVYFRKLDNTGKKWKSYNIDIPEVAGRAKAIKIGDINGDGKPDLVLSTNTLSNESKEGIIWLSYKAKITDSEWDWHPLSGRVGKKFDRIELIDLDGDGDLDVLTCEENYGSRSQGLGVIWYENPLTNVK